MKVTLVENERFPVYEIVFDKPGVFDKEVDIDPSFNARYDRAWNEWQDVQDQLKALFK